MTRSLEVLRLQKELAAATSELIAALNEQFEALVSGEPDVGRLDARIAEAHDERALKMQAFLNHLRIYGW